MPRDTNPQAPALRSHELRWTRYVDAEPKPAHVEFEAADVAILAASATWGAPIDVLGYERLTLLVHYEEGTVTTGVNVAAQVTWDEVTWHDLHVSGATGVVVPLSWSEALSADTDLAFVVDAVGAKMRFKSWASGTDGSDGRLTVRAIRHQNAS